MRIAKTVSLLLILLMFWAFSFGSANDSKDAYPYSSGGYIIRTIS